MCRWPARCSCAVRCSTGSARSWHVVTRSSCGTVASLRWTGPWIVPSDRAVGANGRPIGILRLPPELQEKVPERPRSTPSRSPVWRVASARLHGSSEHRTQPPPKSRPRLIACAGSRSCASRHEPIVIRVPGSFRESTTDGNGTGLIIGPATFGGFDDHRKYHRCRSRPHPLCQLIRKDPDDYLLDQVQPWDGRRSTGPGRVVDGTNDR
jgi:hypothetical protein